MPDIRQVTLAKIDAYFLDPPPYRNEKFLLLGYPIALGDDFIRGRGMELVEFKRLFDFLDYAISHEEDCWLRFYHGFDFGKVRLLFWKLREAKTENLETELIAYCNTIGEDSSTMVEQVIHHGLMVRNPAGSLVFTHRGSMF
jgi:hypothetical protein